MLWRVLSKWILHALRTRSYLLRISEKLLKRSGILEFPYEHLA